MDTQTEKRLDAINEDEIHRGYRIKELPEKLQRQLRDENLPVLSKVRFTRLNPRRRRKIAEVVQGQWQRDIQNPEILSNQQIMDLMVTRREWSDEKTQEMRDLQEQVNRRTSIVYFANIGRNVSQELWDAADQFRAHVRALATVEDTQVILPLFDRWINYSPDVNARYTERYAEAQGRELYNPDADLQRLLMYCQTTEAREILDRCEELRDNAYDLLTLQRDRVRLAELQVKYAKIFSDSAEQRRDNAEEMARMYFTTEQLDGAGMPTGPVVATFDALYDLPEDAVQWLLLESYFFQNGVPDEARTYLESAGFLVAERDSTDKASTSSESEVSAESPVPPNSKDASVAVDTTLVASSA